MSKLAKFIKANTTQSVLNSLSTDTERKANKVTNAAFLKKIKAFSPALELKSDSIGIALEHLAGAVFQSKPTDADAKLFLRALNQWIPAIYTDEGGKSQQAIMIRIRQQIKKVYPKDHKVIAMSYKEMQFDQELWRKERTDYEKKVTAKNNKKSIFQDTDVYNALDVCASSDDWRLNAIGVELSVGSRINEILSLSDFKKVKDKPRWIKQIKISKQKHKLEKDQVKSVVKPIIHLSFEQVMAMIANIRETLADRIAEIHEGKSTDYELSHSVNNQLNEKAAKLFPNSPIKVTTHVARKLYSSLSYKLYADKDEVSEAAWTSKVLAHSPDSTKVASSYTTVSVRTSDAKSGDDEIKHSEHRARDNKLEKQVEGLEDQFEGLSIALKNEAKKGKVEINPLLNVPTNPRLRDGKVYERLLNSVAVMEGKGLPATRENLRALKYGSSTINKYLKGAMLKQSQQDV